MKHIFILVILLVLFKTVFSQDLKTDDDIEKDSTCRVIVIDTLMRKGFKDDYTLESEDKRYFGLDIILEGVDFEIQEKDNILKVDADTANHLKRVYYELPEYGTPQTNTIVEFPTSKYINCAVNLKKYKYIAPKIWVLYQIKLIAKNLKRCTQPITNTLLLDSITTDTMGVNLKMILVRGAKYKNKYIKDFYIGKFEVTQAQWDSVMTDTIAKGYNVSNIAITMDKGKGPDFPQYLMTYEQANVFCEILSKKTGNNYSLPTEMEWEYAAYGGHFHDNFTYSGSDSIAEVAWYNVSPTDKSVQTLHKIGDLKEPNSLGIYAMSGNVREWCISMDKQEESEKKGSKRKATTRGGSISDSAHYCEILTRDESDFSSSTGFRIVMHP